FVLNSCIFFFVFFFSSRRRHTRWPRDWSSDVCSSDLVAAKTVCIYSPEAKLLGTIELSETPSNVSFGDGDLESLFITARTSVYRSEERRVGKECRYWLWTYH